MDDEKRYYQEELNKAKKKLTQCNSSDIISKTDLINHIKYCKRNLTKLKNQKDQD